MEQVAKVIPFGHYFGSYPHSVTYTNVGRDCLGIDTDTSTPGGNQTYKLTNTDNDTEIYKTPPSLFLLVLVACTTSTSTLHENEKNLVGNWMKTVNNGQVQGMYMEFQEDRTGVFGPVINVNGKVGIGPYMSLLMKDWRIQNDTLSIQMEMQSGLVAYGPDGKEIKQNNKPSFARYVVCEVSDTVIVLQDLIEEFPVKDRLRKTEKVGIIE